MYNIIISSVFAKQLKKLSKKYRHLERSVILTLENFDNKAHIHISTNVYKIRLTTPDLNKGKSGSFRLIVYAVEFKKYIVPIIIYYKGDIENIEKKEINDILALILKEIKCNKLL